MRQDRTGQGFIDRNYNRAAKREETRSDCTYGRAGLALHPQQDKPMVANGATWANPFPNDKLLTSLNSRSLQMITLINMAESSTNGQKTLWEKEKLLVKSNFCFSHSFFKRLILHARKNQGEFRQKLIKIKYEKEHLLDQRIICRISYRP